MKGKHRLAKWVSDAVTFHYEALREPRPLLEKLRSLGAEAGLAINPETPVSAIEPLLGACDVVLVMSVSPGFGGQSFEPVALEKLRDLRALDSDLILEVDGGVNSKTIGDCAAAGADSLIVGSAIFREPDYAQAIAGLTRQARAAKRAT